MLGRRDRTVGAAAGTKKLATALILVIGLSVAGCGVSSESTAVDVGDAFDPGAAQNGDSVKSPPSANSANLPEELVHDFFEASVGAGEAAALRAKLFLTAEGQGQWQPEPTTSLTILRVASLTTGTPTGGETPVTVRYRIVGVLTEQGYVEDLVNSESRQMRFVVVPPEDSSGQWRIERIDGLLPDGLFISDEALDTYYRVQPVYFWDNTGRWLVPDLRYLPLTKQPEVRPNFVVQWLLNGPSPWLKPAVQALPTGTSANGAPVARPGGYVVNLSSQAEARGPTGLTQLAYQLSWSLRTTSIPTIELQIDSQARNVAAPADIMSVNPAASLPPPQPFGVVGGKVVSRQPGGASPAPGSVLTAKDNIRVVSAALSRDLNIAAFVQSSSSGQSLVTVRKTGNKPEALRIDLTSPIGRPVFIPGTTHLLVASANRLYLINPANKKPRDITPSGLEGVQAVAVAPDGRRVAIVANGKAWVAALAAGAQNSFTVSSQLRPLLPREVPQAAAVAWQSERRVLIAGSAGGQPALWEATADGVVGKDKSSGLGGSTPTDVVAYPIDPFSSSGPVMVNTIQGAGDFSGGLVIVKGLRSPFYAG